MGEAFLYGQNGGGKNKFDSSEVTVIAKDQLQVGDIVYTIVGDTVEDAEHLTVPDYTTPLTASANTLAFSPDGSLLVVPIALGLNVYSVEGDTLTLEQTESLSTPTAVKFSPDGSKLVINQYLYTVVGTTITYAGTFYANSEGTVNLSNSVEGIAWSHDGTRVVLVGKFAGYAKIYSISGTTITFVSNIYANTGTTALSTYAYSVDFSPNSSTLVIGGNFADHPKVYSVSGTTVTFVSNLSTGGQSMAVKFSPSGDALIVGGVSLLGSTGARIYSVSGTTMTFSGYVYKDAGTTLIGNVTAIGFSPDGTKLIIGGNTAHAYSVSGTTVTFVGNVYRTDGTTLETGTEVVCFHTDNTKFVLGGSIEYKAKIYTFTNNIVSYISYVKKTNSTNELNGAVNAAALSPDGKMLIITGGFFGYGYIFTVNVDTISYVGNVPGYHSTALGSIMYSIEFSPNGGLVLLSDATAVYIYTVSGTTLTPSSMIEDWGSSSILIAKFSPDGSTLVVGGGLAGYAKIYSVSGATITYVSDIYADNVLTALNSPVFDLAFSPDGNTLVLVGLFSGYGKFYSISGATLTYIADLLQASSAPLSGICGRAKFSKDGNKLIVGGNYACIYTVVGTTLTYIMNGYFEPYVISSTLSGIVFLNGGAIGILFGAFPYYAIRYSFDLSAYLFNKSEIANNAYNAIGYAKAGAAIDATATIVQFNDTFNA